MTEPIKIEKGVPLPAPRANAAKYPWKEMLIGDSFFVSSGVKSGWHGMAKRFGIKITVRNEADGIRVWRTE